MANQSHLPPEATPDRLTALSPFRIDEGFSGEYDTNMESVKRWLLSQPLDVRAGTGFANSGKPSHTDDCPVQN